MSVFKHDRSPYYYYEFIVKGRRFRGSTKATSRRDAERVERELKERLKKQAKDGDLRVIYSLSEACGVYWEEKGHRARGKWKEDTARYLQQICKHIDETTPMDALGDRHVNQFVQARMKSFQPGKGHSAINRALAVFRALHNHVKDLHEQPVRAIKWSRHLLNEPTERVRWLTAGELVSLIDKLPEHARVAVAWSVYTGMRLAATYELTWEMINFGKGSCEIVKKGGEKQTIFLSPDALGLLAELPRHGPFVFNGRNRRKLFERALDEAGIKNFRWHDLRHTHATWLRQAGAALEIVQRSLGHKSIKTTQRYAHVADDEMRAALEKIPSLKAPTQGADNVIPLKIKGKSG
jgi:integrase